MGLQGPDLVMVALGLAGDAPPVAEQPRCVDGIHLRWSAPRRRGFPWHGYYLFRRPTRREFRQDCLAPSLNGRSGPAGTSVLPLGVGDLSSDAPLVFAAMPVTGASGVDLRQGRWFRFDRSASRAALRMRVTVAFLPAPGVRQVVAWIGSRNEGARVIENGEIRTSLQGPHCRAAAAAGECGS